MTGSTIAATLARARRGRSPNFSTSIPSGAPCNTNPTRPSAIPSSSIVGSSSMRVRYLIVGAGPTGLGAAWRLEQRGIRDWLIVEAGKVAGGLAQSIVDEHGFTWDLGGHVQFSHYEMFDELMDDLLGGDGWLYHDRDSWVWIRDRFVPY